MVRRQTEVQTYGHQPQLVALAKHAEQPSEGEHCVADTTDTEIAISPKTASNTERCIELLKPHPEQE